MSASRRVAYAIILAALAFYGSFFLWAATRKLTPLDGPISLSRGHIRTEPFSINLRSGYHMQIEVDPTPLFYPECHNGRQCHQSLAMLKSHWVLSSAGQALMSGDSEITDGTSGDLAALGWPIGLFESSDKQYRLDVEIVSDTGVLNQGNPRLMVQIDHNGYERFYELGLILRLISGIWGGIGLALLWVSRPNRNASPVDTLGHSSTLGIAFRSVYSIRRLPPESLFSRLPSFGLYSALVLTLLILSLCVLQGLTLSPSNGIWVWTSSRSVATPGIGPWSKPLVLRIDRKGRWFLDGKSILPEQFPGALKEALGRRSDWAVCLDADSDLNFGVPAQAIDMIQGLQSKIILMTPKMGQDRCIQ